ncbi:hypothetical protein [Streptomyces sp. NPDC058291]|uniref:hypothetical protein n=1 Tax=Streptomyces sp. NPDC058291 TaxID=3346427 RepID=UPI0036E72DA9
MPQIERLEHLRETLAVLAISLARVYWDRRQRGTRTTEHEDCRRLPHPGKASLLDTRVVRIQVNVEAHARTSVTLVVLLDGGADDGKPVLASREGIPPVVAGEAAAESSAEAEVDLGKRLLDYYHTFMVQETQYPGHAPRPRRLVPTGGGGFVHRACRVGPHGGARGGDTAHLALPVPFSEASGFAQQTVVETLQAEGGIAAGAVLAEHAAAISVQAASGTPGVSCRTALCLSGMRLMLMAATVAMPSRNACAVSDGWMVVVCVVAVMTGPAS